MEKELYRKKSITESWQKESDITRKRKEGILSEEKGAKDADMSQSEFLKAMTAAGYKLPEDTKK